MTSILIEQLDAKQGNIITESASDGKNVWLSGIFLQSDVVNGNNRVYPLNEIKNAVDRANTAIKKTNGILGELDHPQTLTINLDRVSHIITEMKMDGKNAIGKAKLLDTPTGNIAKELIKSGVAMGVSSRGAGVVNESDSTVSNYNLVTVDIVATPSAPDAYPTAVFESLEQAKNGKQILSLAESLKNDDAAQKYLQKEISKWLATNIFEKAK